MVWSGQAVPVRLTARRLITPSSRSAFAGFRFPPEVIVVAVRWYLRFGLSYRDVEELLAERGIEVDHVTVHRWVRRFTPLLADAARFGRHRVGDRWHVDETVCCIEPSEVILKGNLTAGGSSLCLKSVRRGRVVGAKVHRAGC